MDDAKVKKLIEEVQARPILWDKSLVQYKNQSKKGHVWGKVATNLNVSKTTAQNKWRSLVKTFKLEHRKVEDHRSGDGLDDCYQSSWEFYKPLLFLGKSAIANPSSGNLDFLGESKPSLISSKNKSVQKIAVKMENKTVAEQLLQVENIKRALLNNNIHPTDKAEYDRCNLSFLETLLPIMRQINEKDLLPCRNDIQRVVYSYVYKDSPWNPLIDNLGKSNRSISSTTTIKKPAMNSDDDIQFVGYFPPSKTAEFKRIKVEVKEEQYIPSVAVAEKKNEYPMAIRTEMPRLARYSNSNNYVDQPIPLQPIQPTQDFYNYCNEPCFYQGRNEGLPRPENYIATYRTGYQNFNRPATVTSSTSHTQHSTTNSETNNSERTEEDSNQHTD